MYSWLIRWWRSRHLETRLDVYRAIMKLDWQ